jgi:ribulose kinase
LFELKGKQIGSVKQDIVMFSEGNAHYEQSSDQIWESVGHCVRTVLSESSVPKDAVIGISFDATCSLVVIGENDQPLPVGSHGKSERNILVWMDQSATPQAKRINEQGHSVLEVCRQPYFSGNIDAKAHLAERELTRYLQQSSLLLWSYDRFDSRLKKRL